MSTFKFDANLRNDWPTNLDNTLSDHAESIKFQLLECEAQKHEHPYYTVHASMMSFLCNTYSGAKNSNLRLEGSLASEFVVKFTMKGEERARVMDPDFVPEVVPAVPVPRPEDHTVRALVNALDGEAWVPKTTKGDRALKAAKVKPLVIPQRALGHAPPPPPPPAPAPSSTAGTISTMSTMSTISTMGTISTTRNASTSTANTLHHVEVVRIADGLYKARAKTSSKLSETSPGVKGAIPMMSVEVKVPDAWQTDDDSSNYTITALDAADAIRNALPQVVQHAQCIFHNWKALNVVWALAACGRFCTLYKFYRSRTPKLDYVAVSDGKYYPHKDIMQIPEVLEDESDESESTDVYAMIDEEGCYTPVFKSHWRKIMVEFEAEFNRIVGGGSA